MEVLPNGPTNPLLEMRRRLYKGIWATRVVALTLECVKSVIASMINRLTLSLRKDGDGEGF